MPIYDFRNTKTGEIFEEMMTISAKEQYLKNNPHIQQLVSGLNIVSGVSGKTFRQDGGWKDNLTRIAEAHPQSNLAKQTLRRDIKTVKTEEVIKKHRKRKKW
tara:strand:+ start:885 stop:1190 length:306 start_codon:yes stop_codon:yes gene_type:complete